MMRRLAFALLLGLISLATLAQVPIPRIEQQKFFNNEDKDAGVAPTSETHSPVQSSTPTAIPGARVIHTLELKALIETEKNVIVIDVLNQPSRDTIPGALAIPGLGDSRFYGAEQARLEAVMKKLTNGDKNKPIIFMCLHYECWESYNASLRALRAGYRDVIWYRGGRRAWKAAGFATRDAETINW